MLEIFRHSLDSYTIRSATDSSNSNLRGNFWHVKKFLKVDHFLSDKAMFKFMIKIKVKTMLGYFLLLVKMLSDIKCR